MRIDSLNDLEKWISPGEYAAVLADTPEEGAAVLDLYRQLTTELNSLPDDIRRKVMEKGLSGALEAKDNLNEGMFWQKVESVTTIESGEQLRSWPISDNSDKKFQINKSTHPWSHKLGIGNKITHIMISDQEVDFTFDDDTITTVDYPFQLIQLKGEAHRGNPRSGGSKRRRKLKTRRKSRKTRKKSRKPLRKKSRKSRR